MGVAPDADARGLVHNTDYASDGRKQLVARDDCLRRVPSWTVASRAHATPSPVMPDAEGKPCALMPAGISAHGLSRIIWQRSTTVPAVHVRLFSQRQPGTGRAVDARHWLRRPQSPQTVNFSLLSKCAPRARRACRARPAETRTDAAEARLAPAEGGIARDEAGHGSQMAHGSCEVAS